MNISERAKFFLGLIPISLVIILYYFKFALPYLPTLARARDNTFAVLDLALGTILLIIALKACKVQKMLGYIPHNEVLRKLHEAKEWKKGGDNKKKYQHLSTGDIYIYKNIAFCAWVGSLYAKLTFIVYIFYLISGMLPMLLFMGGYSFYSSMTVTGLLGLAMLALFIISIVKIHTYK